MAEEIINRVANSKLVTFNLEDFYPEGDRISFDISQWLLEGIVLKEREFRAAAEAIDWSQYHNVYVALYCSTDAIIPAWAYMLLTTKLTPYAKKVVVGTLDVLETIIFTEIIQHMNVDDFKD